METQTAQTLQTTSVALRRTAVFSRIAKQLFDGSSLNLSPSAIGNLLRAAGIPITKDTQISLGAAQILMSGGAFISNLEHASSVSSYAVPTAALLQGVTDLLVQTGNLDNTSVAGQAMVLGSDFAMFAATSDDPSNVMGSVVSELKLIIDIVQLSSSGQNVADGVANSNLRDMIIGRRQNQSHAFATNFKDYQEHKINMFDLIAKVAEDSPDYFANYFPQYSAFFPPTYVLLYAEGEHSDLFGSHTSNASQWVRSIASLGHEGFIKVIWQKLIKPNLTYFKNLDDNEKAQGKISLKSLAVLSLMPPFPSTYPQNFNALGFMKALGLTPDDLGENFLDQYLDSKKVKDNFTAPITLNGVEYLTAKQKSELKINAEMQRVINADLRGDIASLLKESDPAKILNSWAKPDFSISVPLRDSGNTTKLYSKLISDEMTTMPMRNFRNYWSALNLYQMISQDAYFGSIRNELSQYDVFGTIDELEAKHKELLFKVAARKMNGRAIQNIAKFMNTTPQNLVLKSPMTPGTPAVFGYRR